MSKVTGTEAMNGSIRGLGRSAAALTSNEGISGGTVAKVPSESFRMALAAVIIAPIIISYPFFRKYLVKGLTAGAGK